MKSPPRKLLIQAIEELPHHPNCNGRICSCAKSVLRGNLPGTGWRVEPRPWDESYWTSKTDWELLTRA